MRTTSSVVEPRRRELSSSKVKVATWEGNSCFRPLMNSRPSESWLPQPYSLCMSKISDEAWPLCRMPTSRRRVRKVLPVPLLPNTPMDRLTSSSRSRQTLASMSRGLPMLKWRSSSCPKTAATSRSEAAKAREKWAGMLLAAMGASSGSPRARGIIRLGRTDAAP